MSLKKILTLAIPQYLCAIGPGVLSNPMLFPYDTDICVIHELKGTCYIVSRSYVDNWAERGTPQQHPEAKGYGERDVLGYKTMIEDWEEKHGARDNCKLLINVSNLKERLHELGYISSKDSWQETKYNKDEFVEALKKHFRMDDPMDRESEKYIYIVLETRDDPEKEYINTVIKKQAEINVLRAREIISHDYNSAIYNNFYYQAVFFYIDKIANYAEQFSSIFAVRFHIHDETELDWRAKQLEASSVVEYLAGRERLGGIDIKEAKWTILEDHDVLRNLVDYKNDSQRGNFKYVFLGYNRT